MKHAHAQQVRLIPPIRSQGPITNGRQISEAVQRWENVEHDHTRIDLPLVLDTPIPELHLHDDGLLCQRNPNCQYVARSLETMKVHWRKIHHWTAGKHGGRTGEAQRREIEAAIAQSYRRVSCQQVFRTLRGSHYIRIEPGNTNQRIDPENDGQFARFIREAEQRWEEHQRETVIQTDQHNEANPWLRRAGWATYLANIEPDDLRQCIQQPEVDETENRPQAEDAIGPIEKAAHAIWQAMAVVARVAQQTVTTLGHSIRIEAVRTERDQNHHTPLQAYMNEEDIQEHVRPWQQVLMFFTRTQVAHEWTSPVYQMTPRQRKAWRFLWHLAWALVIRWPSQRSSH
ncbi:hypothetical protein PHISCL_10162 [Aspergillus sclerotialis]|uniref:Uncharacterized protein n=1 Tax=Aspergillus sclerotialis TaxID=2070753 RepID=A0A3A2Z430_9EURO|nr:hypothetical protein PHISCL_10162 [Aspergillus sclerotialis]